MTEVEQVYSSKQVARLLDISTGMLRRYSLELEQLTGEAIPQDPRDGRRFAQRHVDVLTAARRFVMGNRGSSVEDGLRRALGMADKAPVTPLLRSLPGDSPDVVAAFAEVVGPLVNELRELRASNTRLADEVKGLREEVKEQKTLPSAAGETKAVAGGGVLVRLAHRIEKLLGRS